MLVLNMPFGSSPKAYTGVDAEVFDAQKESKKKIFNKIFMRESLPKNTLLLFKLWPFKENT